MIPVVVGVNEDDGQAALGKVELGLEDGGQLPPILLLGHAPVQPVLARRKWNDNFADKQTKHETIALLPTFINDGTAIKA